MAETTDREAGQDLVEGGSKHLWKTRGSGRIYQAGLEAGLVPILVPLQRRSGLMMITSEVMRRDRDMRIEDAENFCPTVITSRPVTRP